MNDALSDVCLSRERAMQISPSRNNRDHTVLMPSILSRAKSNGRLHGSATTRKTFVMTVYVIVQLKMTDRAAYDRYQAQFFDVFKKFNGRLLSADEHPTVLEGEWDRDKVVLMSFPDEASFHAWANSPDYLKISRDRKAGAEGIVLLAKGFSA